MYKSLEHTIRMIAEGRIQEPETFLEAKGVHDQEVHDHYQLLKSKPTADVLKMHRARRKVTHNYTARDAGGKDAMISGLMRDKFGHKRVAAHFGLDEDINNTDKFVGNNQTDKPVPVIKPNATQDAKRASLTRANAKERTSQTMGSNVEEAIAHSVYHVSWGPGLDHEVLAKHGDDAIAKAKQHLISKTPKLKDPKYADTFTKKPYVHNITKERKLQEGGIADTIEKGRQWVQDKVKDSPTFKAAQELGHNLPGYADAKDAKQHFAKGEYLDAAKSTLHSLGKAAATGAGVAAGVGAAAVGMGGKNNQLSNFTPGTQHANIVSGKPNVNVSQARRHRVAEETGTDARETIEAMPRSDIKDRKDVQYVGRPDSASSPMDKRSVLIRQEIQKKVIDEEVKKKADTIKKVMKEKQDKGNTATDKETSLGDGKTRVVGDVIINPKLNPQDYTGNVVP